jgi:2-hydroxychromene-2-carboxylate isomerase
MSVTVPQFMFDFGSPNAFLSHEAIPAIEKRIGTQFEYVPVLLGGIFKATNNKSPAETLAGIKNKREFHAIETDRFVKRFQVKPYTWNPFFPVNTLNLMRAAVAAQMEGVFEKYIDAAFRHMWVEPKKMDDPEIAVAALTASGLDAKRLFARAGEADVKAKLNAALSVRRHFLSATKSSSVRSSCATSRRWFLASSLRHCEEQSDETAEWSDQCKSAMPPWP